MRDTPGPPVPVTALLATHPFVARFDDELSLTPGESVIGIRREAGWWHGQNVAGKRGIFPENFVEHAPAPPPPPTAPPSHAGDRARTFGDSTPALSHSAMASFRTAPSSAFEGSTSSSLKRELFEPASRTAAPPTPGAAIGTAALEARLAASAARARADMLRSAVADQRPSPAAAVAKASGRSGGGGAMTGLEWADRLLQMEATVAAEEEIAPSVVAAVTAAAASTALPLPLTSTRAPQRADEVAPSAGNSLSFELPLPPTSSPPRAAAAASPSPPPATSPLKEQAWASVGGADREHVLASLLAQAKGALGQRESELAAVKAQLHQSSSSSSSSSTAASLRSPPAAARRSAALAVLAAGAGPPRGGERSLSLSPVPIPLRVVSPPRSSSSRSRSLSPLGSAPGDASPSRLRAMLAEATQRAYSATAALAAERASAQSLRDELRRVTTLDREFSASLGEARKLAASRLSIVEQMQDERAEADATNDAERQKVAALVEELATSRNAEEKWRREATAQQRAYDALCATRNGDFGVSPGGGSTLGGRGGGGGRDALEVRELRAKLDRGRKKWEQTNEQVRERESRGREGKRATDWGQRGCGRCFPCLASHTSLISLSLFFSLSPNQLAHTKQELARARRGSAGSASATQPQPQPQPQRTRTLERPMRYGHSLPASPPQLPPPQPQLGGVERGGYVRSAPQQQQQQQQSHAEWSGALTPGAAGREIDELERQMMEQMNPFRVNPAAAATPSAPAPAPLTPALQREQREQQTREQQWDHRAQPPLPQHAQAQAQPSRGEYRAAVQLLAPRQTSGFGFGAGGVAERGSAEIADGGGGGGGEVDYAAAERELLALHSSIYGDFDLAAAAVPGSAAAAAMPSPPPAAPPTPPQQQQQFSVEVPATGAQYGRAAAVQFGRSAPASPPGQVGGGSRGQSNRPSGRRSAAQSQFLGSTPLGVQRERNHVGRIS